VGRLLSEILKLTSKDVKTWLEREAGSVLKPVHAKAEKLLSDMRKTLADLSEVSKTLFDNSAKEIEKRNMKTYRRARVLNKLARLFLERTRQIRVPDKVSYDSFSDFLDQVQKVIQVTEFDIRNWFPRISPFFIIDRRRFQLAFEKAKLTLNELRNFQNKEYVKTKTLEETFQLGDRVVALEGQLTTLRDRKCAAEQHKASIEAELNATEQKMIDLRSKGSISQLNQTSSEIEALTAEIRQSLQHLQKPFIKLHSLATHGEGSGLIPEELAKLSQYLEDPFEAFSTEEPGHPLLKRILQKLDRAIADGKLKLKPEKIRKAEQAIDGILNKDSLSTLHRKAANTRTRKSQLSTSAEVAATQQDMYKLQARCEDIKTRREVVDGELISVQKTCNEMVDKIHSVKSDIEKNIFGFMGKRAHVE
jgi:predicted  nucleic acid-binding Zn-ribbon protein